MMKYELSIFRFDFKTDYLPYYKRYTLKADVKDIRGLLQAVDDNVAIYDCAVVNGWYMDVSTPMEKVVEKFGNELTIEPISQARVMKDLQIDTKDFYEKIAPLERFMDDSDKEKYARYKMHYYASISLKYNRDYIGDGVLAIAKDLLQKNRENEREILEYLFDEFGGLQYHVSSQNKVLEYDTNLESVYHYAKDRAVQLGIIKDKPLKLECKHEPSQKEIKFKRGLSQPMAIEAFKYDKNFAYKIAGEVLLEAIDNNVDAILVDDENSLKLLKHHQKKIACVVGRDIDVCVVSA
jgi:hypothetical protein